jgi:phenylalanyl-tRNA synthetase alpha chain
MERNKPPIRTISSEEFFHEAISLPFSLYFSPRVKRILVNFFCRPKIKLLLHFTKRDIWQIKNTLTVPLIFRSRNLITEIDIYWGLKARTDYRITKGTGWFRNWVVCGMSRS